MDANDAREKGPSDLWLLSSRFYTRAQYEEDQILLDSLHSRITAKLLVGDLDGFQAQGAWKVVDGLRLRSANKLAGTRLRIQEREQMRKRGELEPKKWKDPEDPTNTYKPVEIECNENLGHTAQDVGLRVKWDWDPATNTTKATVIR